MPDLDAHAPSLLRPRDGDALRGELRSIAAHALAPVLFGREVQDDTLHLSEFVGTRTNNLEGLAIPSRSGLGGRVVAQRAPASVDDYGSSSTITHHFDRHVHREGLRSVLAVPVVVRGTSRAVLYAAIRDEIDRRLEMMGTLDDNGVDGASAEEMRDIHAELRSVAQTITDPSLQARLRGFIATDRRRTPAWSRLRRRGDRRSPLATRDRRAVPHCARMHEPRRSTTPFSRPRDGEEPSTQRHEQARLAVAPRGGGHRTQTRATPLAIRCHAGQYHSGSAANMSRVTATALSELPPRTTRVAKARSPR